MTTPNRHERAFWTWLLLTDLAARGRTSRPYGGQYPGRVTYQELADLVGGSPVEIGGNVLELVQEHCEEQGYPPLTGLVVSSTTGDPSRGFRHPSAKPAIYTFRWERVANPFVGGVVR